MTVVAGLAFAAPTRAATATCEELLVALPDGARLHGWARHGAHAAPHRPVVWTMTPYTNTGCRGNIPYNAMTAEMVEQVTIVSISYRGTGASEGVQDLWGPGDRADIQAVGDWLAARPYANGLFPTGASAEGAWITFALDHPAVIGGLWFTSCADGYRQCVRSGGQLAGGAFALTAGEAAGYVAGVPDRIRNGTLHPAPPVQLAGLALKGAPAFLEDTNGRFWDSRLGLEYLDGIRVPVMFTTDLYDFVPAGMYLAYERLRDHAPPGSPGAWLSTIIGHNAPASVADDSSLLGQLALTPIRRFLSKYLFGEGGDDPPRVVLATNLGSVTGYDRGEVLVRNEDDWPLPSTDSTRLYLGDGTLSVDPTRAGHDATPMATVFGPFGELRTAKVIASAAGQSGPSQSLKRAYFDDQRVSEAIGLTYTTPALRRDTEISGPIILEMRARASAPDFDWQVRLTDVHPDGSSAWITDGQLRASLRRVDDARSVRDDDGDYIRPWLPYSKHEPVPLLKPVDYVIELAPTSNVFRAGHRIRLDIQPIATGYVDSARTGGVGVLDVIRGGITGSRLVLPVIPARCQLGLPGLAGITRPECGAALAF
jgi:putative CocE/NonD family hydrolase